MVVCSRSSIVPAKLITASIRGSATIFGAPSQVSGDCLKRLSEEATTSSWTSPIERIHATPSVTWQTLASTWAPMSATTPRLPTRI